MLEMVREESAGSDAPIAVFRPKPRVRRDK
jgi:hypothetical protein